MRADDMVRVRSLVRDVDGVLWTDAQVEAAWEGTAAATGRWAGHVRVLRYWGTLVALTDELLSRPTHGLTAVQVMRYGTLNGNAREQLRRLAEATARLEAVGSR